MSLFIKECKQITKSIIYLSFVSVTILFYVTQLGDFAGDDIKDVESNAKYSSVNPLMKPPEDISIGTENYGQKQAEIPEQIMPTAIVTLLQEYAANKYATYPIGFYKNVKLDEKQQLRITEIITEATGKTPQDLGKIINENNQEQLNSPQDSIIQSQNRVPIPFVISYDIFKEKMDEIDQLLGGGSNYCTDKLLSYGQRPITYEEKLDEYNTFLSEDKITGAYARLFCDYMGITIGLFSIFLPVAFAMCDKKGRINELIYSRKKSSLRIIFSRYLALVFMSILPILLLSILPAVQLISYGIRVDAAVDIFAFVKYIIVWLLPTLLTTTAVGMFFTILTDTPIAILLQFIWSFTCLSVSVGKINGGNYSYELFLRHNTLGNLQAVKDSIHALVLNRAAYTVFAFILIVAAALIYEQKRRGKIHVGNSLQKVFRRNKDANQILSSN